MCHHIPAKRKSCFSVHAVFHKGIKIVNSGYTAPISQGTDHLIRQIARMPGQRSRIRMTGNKRLSRVAEYIPDACIVQMRNIYDHTKPFHLLHKGNAGFRQSMHRIRNGPVRSHTLIFSVWKSKLIWEVPGDRHHSGPQPVKIPQAGKITAADASLFEGQQG